MSKKTSGELEEEGVVKGEGMRYKKEKFQSGDDRREKVCDEI